MNLMFENPNTGENESFLCQWDQKVRMYVELKNVDKAEAVFWYTGMSEGIRRTLSYTNKGWTCTVPDLVLERGEAIYISIQYTNDGRKTVHEPIQIPVRKQARPEGWISDDDPEYITLSTAIGMALDVINRVDEVKQEIENKAEEAIDSIPSDYTQLSKHVDEIGEDVFNLSSDNFPDVAKVSPIRDWATVAKGAVSGTWITNKSYPEGKVKNFLIKAGPDGIAAGRIYLYKDNKDGSITYLRGYATPALGASQEYKVAVEEEFDYPFMLGTDIVGVGYKDYEGTYYTANNNAGGTFTPNFRSHLSICLGAEYYSRNEFIDALKAGKMSIQKSDLLLSKTNMDKYGYTSVLDLPVNRVYMLENTIGQDYGLPRNAYGTLVILQPYNFHSPDDGWKILMHVYRVKGIPYIDYAFTYTGQNVEELIWSTTGSLNPRVNARFLDGIGNGANIAMVGDSIMAGQFSSDYSATGSVVTNDFNPSYRRNVGSKAWAAMFKSYVESTYSGVTITNNAVPGIGLEKIYTNIDRLAPTGCTHAIICAGTNDIAAADKDTVIKGNLIKIIDNLVSRGIKPIVLTTTPLQWNNVNKLGKGKNHNVISAFVRDACNDRGVQVYDLCAELDAYMDLNNIDITDFIEDIEGNPAHSGWGYHPNDFGHRLIFLFVKKLLGV